MIDETDQAAQGSTLGTLFSRFIVAQAGAGDHAILGRTACWLADVYDHGDVCLDLHRHAAAHWPDHSGETPGLKQWRDALLHSGCVGKPGDTVPMILDGDHLYLNRFWQYEEDVAHGILARLQTVADIDIPQLKAGLQRLFGATEDSAACSGEVNWQKLAAALALMHYFAVISGGPGTGKTTSLVKVLALLLEQQPAMRIRLAAPTGKAAVRMMESIRLAKADMDTDAATRAHIPEQASTLHRLLGYSPRGFRHHKHNPLMLDCLVIDEASMIDLAMMARLLEAIPASARLILLGDRDQLASVDSGNVLGDITGHGREIAYNQQTAALLADLTAIDESLLPVADDAPAIADAIAVLKTSYRFHADSGIGCLAGCVNVGDTDQAVSILSDVSHAGLSHTDLLHTGLSYTDLSWQPDADVHALLDQAASMYAPYLQEPKVDKALRVFESCRVLCAVRHGSVGVDEANRQIAARLVRQQLMGEGEMVHGMPVMVTVNSYEMNLFNGDIGLLWRDHSGALCAWFRQVNHELRAVPVNLLPAHELCWAMTVHKSQGSEFDRVILLLPDSDSGHSPLSRELFYTAITRTRQQFTLFGNAATVSAAVQQTLSRSTGLSARLHWPAKARNAT